MSSIAEISENAFRAMRDACNRHRKATAFEAVQERLAQESSVHGLQATCLAFQQEMQNFNARQKTKKALSEFDVAGFNNLVDSWQRRALDGLRMRLSAEEGAQQIAQREDRTEESAGAGKAGVQLRLLSIG